MSLAALQYEVLGHHLGLTEVRQFGKRRDFAKNQQEFEELCAKSGQEDTYVGINPRKEEKGTSDSVSHLTCMVLDIDPIREKGAPSTDEQHNEAIELGRTISNDLYGAILVDSGSGCHLYFPIEPILVINPVGLTNSTRNWLNLLRKKYSSKTLKIDPIHDLARVIRVWGSFNNKSKRYCRPITEIKEIHRAKLELSQEVAPRTVREIEVKSDLEDRFKRLCLTNIQMRRIMSESVHFPSPSEADFAFVSCLAKAHFTVNEIKSLYNLNPQGNKEAKPNDVERIVKKVFDEGVGTVSMIHNTDAYFASIQSRKMGLKTGFNEFDEMVSGLKESKVIVFAARPTEGKTTLATQILANIAEQGKTCLYFPTEVGAEPIYDKIVSRKAEISLKKFQNGNFTAEEVAKISQQREYLSSLPLVVCEDFALTVDKIEEKIQETAPQVVALDYIQAMRYNGGNAGEVATEMAANVRKIKEMACSYNIPFLLFSQLRRGEGKLELSQLKGSGALEELTDIISFLYTADFLVYPREVDLAVLKSKYSATGIIKLKFYATTCNFMEATSNINNA